SHRPPSFYAAAAICGLLLAGLAARLAVLYADLVLVLPILLFEERHGRVAIRESRERIRGARLRGGAILLGWQVIGTMLGVSLVWGFNRSCGMLLTSAEVNSI